MRELKILKSSNTNHKSLPILLNNKKETLKVFTMNFSLNNILLIKFLRKNLSNNIYESFGLFKIIVKFR